MQSLSFINLQTSCGLPLCLSGITHPLGLSKEMADHDRRREAMKRQKFQSREVSQADQEVGVIHGIGTGSRHGRVLEEEIREEEEGEEVAAVDDGGQDLLLLLLQKQSYNNNNNDNLPFTAKAA